MSSPLKDIYWLASPLAIDQRNELNAKINSRIDASSSKNIRALKHLRKPIDPSKEIHVFRKIQHWTLEVDGKSYELSPDTKKKLQVIKKATDMIKPHWIDSNKWKEIRKTRDIEPERRHIGQTRKTHDEIWAQVNFIWNHFNGDWYGFFTQNCQNFTHMLFERIADKEPEKSFEHIPDPIGYRLADGAQLALATKIASGGKAAYVGAMGAKAGSTAMGTMGATTTTGASGAIGGSTAAGSTAAGTTAASTTTTTAAATSSTAATTSTTAGASGASHIGLGAKAATFGTKAGLGTKSALGAKAVAAMHTPHAAAIGSGMVKVGIAAAYTHPVSCLAMTGGLAYLAFRGKRGKGWIKRNRDVTGFELL
ncbi:MAG: hypothetical protein Q9192_007532, partial [Flavoplaca navasiana]